ncbi:MAG: hypothetical protein ACTS5G_03780 [Burkholderiales bacterium]
MSSHKPRPPTGPAARPPTKQNERALARTPNPLQQADSRWQRTVRFGWDKGGSRGGRK